MKQGLCYVLLFILCVLVSAFCFRVFAFQIRCFILEGRRQNLLAEFKKEGSVFLIPENATRGFTTSRRLVCENIDFSFSHRKMDMDHFEEDTLFPHFKEYYLDYWQSDTEYPVCNTPSAIRRFKWLDVFRYFPHPLFYRKPNISESSAQDLKTLDNQEQTP